MMNKVIHGDCLEVLKGMADNSVDSIVTDPPYGLAFMGKKWDYDVPSEDIWRECLRVLKPGGHLLAFAGTRTQHRMAVRIEDAGFEIRDMIAWVYGSGFPKSHNVGKMIDKMAGAEREVTQEGLRKLPSDDGKFTCYGIASRPDETAPATEAAQQWQGWGTALKPALEPITVARKPFKGTLAENVLEWGTGGINVDGCRVGTDEMREGRAKQKGSVAWQGDDRTGGKGSGFKDTPIENPKIHTGRWPANLILDGSDEVVGMFPETDSGSAARFFYQAKASRAERNAGMGDAPNGHPTIKPIALMRYLVRLVTPPNGIVLDPFGGSGSTACGAVMEGMQFVTIEREAEYIPIIEARVAHWTAEAEAEAKEKKKADNQLSLF